MKFIKVLHYVLDVENFLSHAVEQVTGISQSDADSSIDLPDLQTAIDVAELILRKHVELTPRPIAADAPGLRFSPRRNLDKAFVDIGGLRALDRDGVKSLFDLRFVGDPEISYRVNGMLEARRRVEIRVGRKVETLKTIVFEGEEFTRKVLEEKWSEWYPGTAEIISIYIRTCHRVTLGA